MAISSFRRAGKERAADLDEKRLREWLLELWVPVILGRITATCESISHPASSIPAQFTCASGGDLRYHSVYYPTNLTLNLVRFGVDRTFEIMMHR